MNVSPPTPEGAGSSARVLVGGLSGVVLPAVLALLVSHCYTYRGPYWLSTPSNPEYSHLLEALAIEGYELPRYFDHPGSPLTFLQAVVLRVAHASAGESTLARAVLGDPEAYLDITNQTLLAIAVGLLLASGVMTLWVTKSVTATWLVQLAPFLTTACILALTRSSPQTFLVALSCGLPALVFGYHRWGETRPQLFVAGFAALVAVAVATAQSALPLLLLPLILLPGRRKWEFLIYTSVFIALWFLSAQGWSSLRAPFRLFGQLARTLKSGLLDTSLDTHWRLVSAEPFVPAVIVLSLFALFRGPPTAAEDAPEAHAARTLRRCLVAVTIVEVSQFLFAATGPRSEDSLAAALGLLGLNLALIVQLGRRTSRPRASLTFVSITLLLLAPAAALHASHVWSLPADLEDGSADQMAIEDEVHENYSHCTIIHGAGASSRQRALWRANLLVGGRFSNVLRELGPESFFLESNAFQDFLSTVEWETIAAGKECVLIRGRASLQEELPAGVRVRQVYPEAPGEAGAEVLYRVILPGRG